MGVDNRFSLTDAENTRAIDTFKAKLREKQMMSEKARLLINAYGQAAVDQSWKGGGDPADIPEIERRYQEAYKALSDYIKGLESLQHTIPTV